MPFLSCSFAFGLAAAILSVGALGIALLGLGKAPSCGPMLYSCCLLEGAVRANHISRAPIMRSVTVVDGRLLPVNGALMAPESLDARRDSPREVVAVRVPVMPAITVVRFRWRRQRGGVLRLKIDDAAWVNEDSVAKDVLLLEEQWEVDEDGVCSFSHMDDLILVDMQPNDLGDGLWVACPC